VVRGALGAKRISYFGYSYGSYLGEVYTRLFPGRTDRMVLDGILHPDQYSTTLLAGTEPFNERSLHAWAAWTAARDAAYGLGDTSDAVLATVDRIQQAAAEAPLRIGDFRLDEHFVPVVFFIGLASDLDESRAALAAMAQVLERAADRDPAVRPGPELAELLTFLTTKAGSQQASAQAAIICGDVAARRGIGSYWRAIQASRAAYPFAGPLTNNISPCEFWDSPVEAPTVLDNDIPALLVNATGDPRTLYSGALRVRRQWSHSRLITLPGVIQHGVYGEYGNACADQQVNAYLATGRLPEHDLTCHK
jgi:pimeloyl-ACP methyl ester carboxylesterase